MQEQADEGHKVQPDQGDGWALTALSQAAETSGLELRSTTHLRGKSTKSCLASGSLTTSGVNTPRSWAALAGSSPV